MIYMISIDMCPVNLPIGSGNWFSVVSSSFGKCLRVWCQSISEIIPKAPIPICQVAARDTKFLSELNYWLLEGGIPSSATIIHGKFTRHYPPVIKLENPPFMDTFRIKITFKKKTPFLGIFLLVRWHWRLLVFFHPKKHGQGNLILREGEKNLPLGCLKVWNIPFLGAMFTGKTMDLRVQYPNIPQIQDDHTTIYGYTWIDR